MNNSNSSQRPGEPGRLADLSRLVRRICLLREQGDPAGAERLETNDLAPAVEEFRRRHGVEALRQADLVALFADEARRVADALLTAEIMINHLAERWAPLPGVVRAASVPPASAAARSAPAAPAGPPAITDLLDAMLAAERTSTRLSPARNS